MNLKALFSLRRWMYAALGCALACGWSCSNPTKPHIVKEPVITVTIAVTAQVTVTNLLPKQDVKLVTLDIYHQGTLTGGVQLDYSLGNTKEIDPQRIGGTDVSVVAKAFNQAGQLVYFGYIDRPFISPDQSCSLNVVLNWSMINTRTAHLIDDYIYSICVDQSSAIWVATHEKGAGQFNGTVWKQYTTANGLPDNCINDILCDQNNAIWAATPQGVAVYDQATKLWKTYTTTQGLIDNRVQRLYTEAGTNAIWCGTLAGASRFDGTAWKSYPALGNVSTIFQAADGTLWFGTDGQGVKKMVDTTITAYTVNDGLPSNYIWSIAQESPSVLWFGTSLGAASFDGTTWQAYDGTRFAPHEVYAVRPDHSNLLDKWFVTAWNISRLNSATWHQYQTIQSYMHYNNLYIDTQNYKWFSTTGNGIVLYLGN
jgi:ligand-binding sensor domain-containing protein